MAFLIAFVRTADEDEEDEVALCSVGSSTTATARRATLVLPVLAPAIARCRSWPRLLPSSSRHWCPAIVACGTSSQRLHSFAAVVASAAAASTAVAFAAASVTAASVGNRKGPSPNGQILLLIEYGLEDTTNLLY
ncbi:hypothetical protein LR48_Vigan10g064900 [Vigna angularis]|uniref:Uncharacterized protein n=1 Tax=Phaseolus angularis TaxID=3914 RepID=A0A0L9VIL9_PHAAN|nr:hypothetical protein LR48_Vigan10g064900 [Vigna angularis]